MFNDQLHSQRLTVASRHTGKNYVHHNYSLSTSGMIILKIREVDYAAVVWLNTRMAHSC